MQNGVSGGFTYTTKANMADKPVNYRGLVRFDPFCELAP